MILHAIIIIVTFMMVNVTSASEVYRLPKSIKPIRYHLTIEPHLHDEYSNAQKMLVPYEGSVVIELQALENTTNITLHKVHLKINEENITILDKNTKILEVNTASEDKDTETYTIRLKNELVKGEGYILHIGSFKGHLRQRGGIIKAYFGQKNLPIERDLIITDFKTVGARNAFPCFDEPSFKAKFTISLIRTSEHTSVSNENLTETENLGEGRFKDTFKETPLMSTFTLAFAITNYEYSEKLERHRILTKIEDDASWKFSLDVANRTLRALEEYTGIDFVLDKMDHIVIPDTYFHKHAMANLGLVFYGESNLMQISKGPKAVDYKRSVLNIAQEFTSQWFGNLVTPDWWDHSWLSDSFSTYFQYYIADEIQPLWRLKDQFLVDMVHEALKSEAERGAYPMNAEIKEIFFSQFPGKSELFYPHLMKKGASIVSMMAHFLTHTVFRMGLQIYLQKNKFSNVLPSDLYAAFQEALDITGDVNLLNNLSVAEIMKSWVGNKGFPIITVTRNYKTGELTIAQESRFKEKDDTTITKWTVPINYNFSASGKLDFTKTFADYWLTETKATINHNFSTDGWVLVDKQATGYYRVNYDLENWKRIIQTLKSKNFESINVLNRAKLIDDAFNLAYIGKLSWDIPASLSEYIIQETDYIPLNAFYRALHHINYIEFAPDIDENPASLTLFVDHIVSNERLMKNSTNREIFKKYVNTTLAGVKNWLGFEEKFDDTHLDQIHRVKFLDVMYFIFK